MKTFSSKAKRLVSSIAIVLAWLCMGFPCFADIRTQLPSYKREGLGLLPVDSVIGIVVQPDASEKHSFLHQALSFGEYGYEWMESFVQESSRSDVSAVLGPWLADNLPLDGFVMSQALENGDGSVSINVRADDDALCFVVDSVLDGDGSPYFAITAAKIL